MLVLSLTVYANVFDIQLHYFCTIFDFPTSHSCEDWIREARGSKDGKQKRSIQNPVNRVSQMCNMKMDGLAYQNFKKICK